MIPQITHYGKTKTNRDRVDLGNLSIYYSYGRPVAFSLCGSSGERRRKAVFLASENAFSTTTGRHLSEAERDFAARFGYMDETTILKRAEPLVFSRTLDDIGRLLYQPLDDDKTTELWAMMGDESARREV